MKEKITSVQIPAGLYITLLGTLILGMIIIPFNSFNLLISATQQVELINKVTPLNELLYYPYLFFSLFIPFIYYYGFRNINKLVKWSSLVLLMINVIALISATMTRNITVTNAVLKNTETISTFTSVICVIASFIGAIGFFQCISDKKKYIGVLETARYFIFFLTTYLMGNHTDTSSIITTIICRTSINILLTFTLFYLTYKLFQKESYQEIEEDDLEALEALSEDEKQCHWILSDWSMKGKIAFIVSFIIQLVTLYSYFAFFRSDVMKSMHLAVPVIILMLISSWSWYVVWMQLVEALSPAFGNLDKNIMKKVMFFFFGIWRFSILLTMVLGRINEPTIYSLQTTILSNFVSFPIIGHIVGYLITRRSNLTAKKAYKYVGGVMIIIAYLFIIYLMLDQYNPYDIFG